jgi:hypothetical protein
MDILELKEIVTASTEPQTGVAPLIPQSQGVKALDWLEAIFIPRGNAIPIHSPSGKSIPAATRIRTVVLELRNRSVAPGVNLPKAYSMTRSRANRTMADLVRWKLPTPWVK